MIERAGLRRRAAAALVDMALTLFLVQGLAAVGFQLTGGHVTTGFSLSTVCSSTTTDALDLPRGDAVPADFTPNHAALCRSTVLGATTGLTYVLSRTETHAGLDVTTSHAFPVDLAWHAAGGRVDLDPFLLPLFVLIRWAFDRFTGATPGRWLARIRIAEAESTGARVGVALGADLTRRYRLFARPYVPILVVGAVEALFAALMGSETLVITLAAGVAVAVAVASQAVAAAAILDGRSTFYDRPCATLVADLASLEAPRPASTRFTATAAAPAGTASKRLTGPIPGRAFWFIVLLSCVGAFWIGLSRPTPVHDVRPVPIAGRPAPSTRTEVAAAPAFGPDKVAARSAEAAEIAARAEAEAERGDTSGSLKDVAYAISVEQGVTDTAVSRDFAFETEATVGHNLFLAGDLLDAITEDTHALTLRNGDVRLLKQRSIAEFYMAELPDALADLDAALTTAPGDAQAALWREIVAHRLGRTSRIEADARTIAMTQWPAPIVDLYEGRSSPATLLSRVYDFDLSLWKLHHCEAEFFIGEWHVIRGEVDEARDSLRAALKDCPGDTLEAHEAEDELLGRAGFR